MKGGYQIIDIRKLNLTLSNSTQSITDAEILEQLRNLRAYIQKGHDFTKPLDNALKCIQIRYRDQKNGEKLEACQWANIETSNNSLTYEIKTKNLMIEVVFEEKTDEYSNKYYDIKTAKYLYNHNEIVEGDLDVSGDISIGGDAEIEGDLSVGGDIESEGKITADEIIENMSGYSLDTAITEVSELDVIYGGACKNGNKLTLVLFASFKKPSATGTKTLARFVVPSEIGAKLYPTEIITGYQTLEIKNVDCVDSSGNIVPSQLSIYKPSPTAVDFNLNINDLTADTTYFARCEITFLLSENLVSNE